MKTKMGLLIVVLSLVLTSCSSTKSAEKENKENKTEKEEVTPPSPERTFKLDYELVDASDKALPDWLKDPSKVEKSSDERKNFRYFINESSHVNQRLCEKSAETRATAHIGSEIAQFMKNSYAEATQGGASEEVTEYMQEQLAQEAQSFVVGASVIKRYWEKRHYKELLGASEDKVKYYCFAVVRMSKKDIEKAVERSRAKLLKEIQAPEVKVKTDKALSDVAKKFSELDKPVPVKGETEE
jgi:PBP1b-binding outer membrane lipoprotein LpoB